MTLIIEIEFDQICINYCEHVIDQMNYFFFMVGNGTSWCPH